MVTQGIITSPLHDPQPCRLGGGVWVGENSTCCIPEVSWCTEIKEESYHVRKFYRHVIITKGWTKGGQQWRCEVCGTSWPATASQEKAMQYKGQ